MENPDAINFSPKPWHKNVNINQQPKGFRRKLSTSDGLFIRMMIYETKSLIPNDNFAKMLTIELLAMVAALIIISIIFQQCVPTITIIDPVPNPNVVQMFVMRQTQLQTTPRWP